MFKCSMVPGLGPQGKLEGLCVGGFNSPATSIYKFKWVVISCLAFLLTEVIWNFYFEGAIYDLIQVC